MTFLETMCLLMPPSDQRASGFVKRMAEDMAIRSFADATIDSYTYHIAKFAEFVRKRLDCVDPEDIRRFQLYMVKERKLGWSCFNPAVWGLRFLHQDHD